MTNADHTAIINSALWAAAGDALGWITELSRDGTVEARTGLDRIVEPVEWRRFIGGKMGVRVHLPAGTYSDDTQLRLAVSRSIRGDGNFDAEVFARIELTAWQAYLLGAGNGTKTAAANLAKRGVNWFSNFFDKGANYISAGGNGAAMRIQPHVWATPSADSDRLFVDVIRDALITHGHPHGFVGAALHAAMLFETISRGKLPAYEDWQTILASLVRIPSWIEQDRQLAAFWRPAWEQTTGQSLGDAVHNAIDEADRDIEAVLPILASKDPARYTSALEAIGCLSDKYRGSGLKTALAASVLAHLYEGHIEDALIRSANTFASDTDTIGTMAGALLGAIEPRSPKWLIQDRDYIVDEAQRLARIRDGIRSASFPYPDLNRWAPPSTQSDAVGEFGAGLALLGLGQLEPIGEEYAAADAVWQWFSLPFGQTVLAKRRKKLKLKIEENMLPGRRSAAPASHDDSGSQAQLAFDVGAPASELRGTVARAGKKGQSGHRPQGGNDIDSWTDEVIRSGFDDLTLGQLLNYCIDKYGSIESAASFAGIIAKAKIARQRRHNSR
ncbi:ADP-ribosylglycohydrolase family protein [Pelagibacterium lacus]|uniref:ADP-ribosylglycohydrolase family protein n=1 Tax=Pelagibacterium lacus TaxID=2282655 RepID=UPI001FECCD43|nr:ADP-ribosylglycohydrolase family protein [Pelagibacterium lacus]